MNENLDTLRERTMRLSLIEGCVWSVMSAFGESYLIPFAVFLRAGNRAVGFLGAMPALIGALSQRLGAALVDLLQRRKPLIVAFCALQGFLFIPLYAVPRLFPQVAVPALLLFSALVIGAGNAVAPAWTSMMSEVVPAERRGDYFGQRSRYVILTLFLAMMCAGGILAGFQRLDRVWLGFGVLFGVAFVVRSVSAYLLTQHWEPPYAAAPEAQFSFWDFLRRLPRSNFARFAVSVALMHGAISVASPFINVFFLRDLKWSYGAFTINAAAFQAVQFLLVRWWGRIGDRHGNRLVVLATSALLPAIPLLFALTTNYLNLLLIQMFAGAVWAGFALGTQNFMFDAVTPPKRARIAAYMAILNGACTLLGATVIGAWLATHLPADYRVFGAEIRFRSPLQPLFIVSAALRAVGAILLMTSFREVKPVEPLSPFTLLLRLSGGEALAGLIQAAITRLPGGRRRP